MDSKQFHEALKSRRARVMTQAEMAKRLGITETWLSLLERGKRPWQLEHLKAYCAAVDFVQPDYHALPVLYVGQRKRGPRPKGRRVVALTESQEACAQIMSKALGVSPEVFMAKLVDAAWAEYKAENPTLERLRHG
jgi:transcriptional regulator with XRE-family HTH domain